MARAFDSYWFWRLPALILYLAPLIWSIDLGLDILSAAEVTTRANAWKFGNRIRLIVEMCGFVCSIIALRVWSAESNEVQNLEASTESE